MKTSVAQGNYVTFGFGKFDLSLFSQMEENLATQYIWCKVALWTRDLQQSELAVGPAILNEARGRTGKFVQHCANSCGPDAAAK